MVLRNRSRGPPADRDLRMRWLDFRSHSTASPDACREKAGKQAPPRCTAASVECLGYLRDDGLWEVEARSSTPNPSPRLTAVTATRLPGDPVHDIRLRLAVDDSADHPRCRAPPWWRRPTRPASTSRHPAAPGRRADRQGWREAVRARSAARDLHHLSELLGPAVTTLFQTMASGSGPGRARSIDQPARSRRAAVLPHRRQSWRRRNDRGRALSAVRDACARQMDDRRISAGSPVSLRLSSRRRLRAAAS